MPELPEVETVRRGLEPLVVGATIDRVEVLRESCVRRQAGGSGEFAAALTGSRISAVARRGKFLWMPLDDADAADSDDPTPLVVSAHLGMSGQFRVAQAPDAPPHSHCRVRLRLDRDGEQVVLDFLDQRTFGYLTAEPSLPTADGLPGGQGSALAATPLSVAHIARDALDPSLDDARAADALRRSSRGIKQVLLDQQVISGIGNIYADEALWHAGVHPATQASALDHASALAVLRAAREVMLRALRAARAALRAVRKAPGARAHGGPIDALVRGVPGGSSYRDDPGLGLPDVRPIQPPRHAQRPAWPNWDPGPWPRAKGGPRVRLGS